MSCCHSNNSGSVVHKWGLSFHHLALQAKADTKNGLRNALWPKVWSLHKETGYDMYRQHCGKNLRSTKYQHLGDWNSLIDFTQNILSEHFHDYSDCSLNKMHSAGGGQCNLAIVLKREHLKQYSPANASARRKAGHYPEGCPVCRLQTHKHTVQGPH